MSGQTCFSKRGRLLHGEGNVESVRAFRHFILDLTLVTFFRVNIRCPYFNLLLILLCVSIQSIAQQKNMLIIIPTDSVGILSFKNEKLIFEAKNSADARKKLNQFANSWVEKGYLSFNIDSIAADSNIIKAYVFVGYQYLWDSIGFDGIPPSILNNTSFGIRSAKKKKLNLKSYLKFRKEIISYCENNGYPFASLQIDSVDIVGQCIKGNLILRKNSLVQIDSIVLKGNPKISRRYFVHYLQIKPGDVYNQSKINETRKLVGDLQFIEQAKPVEYEFRKGKVDLYFYLKNKPANFFNGMIGFASGTVEKPEFQVTGDLNLILVNSFKIGEKINIYWDKYQANSQNLKLGFQFPYIFILPIGVDLKVGLEKNNIDYLNTNLYAAADYSFSANHKMIAYLSQKKSYLIDNSENTDTTLASVSRFTAGLSFYINTTDYYLNPRKGYLLDISTGYGNRSTQVSGSASVAEIAFKGEWYAPVGNLGVIAFLNKTAGLFANTGFYGNELFKIGGINTIRGFDEQSILASSYSIISIEPRLMIGKNSSAYLFGDLAWYQSNQIDKMVTDMPFGFGIGMNIDTKAGIFKLNYALGKQFDNPIKISSSKVHFGFYARF